MRRLVLPALALACALGAALGLPLAVSAHALAQSSDPADGATVEQSPRTVTITFGEEPDSKLSSIRVLDTSGQSYDAGATQPVPGNADQLRVAVKPLPRGVYTVSWRTVSAVDGHFAAGAFAFGVGVSAAGAAGAGASVSGAGTPPPSALAVAGRWMLFAGLVLLLGGAFTGLVVLRGPPARPIVVQAVAGLLLTLLGTFAVAEAQREAADVSWSDVFATSLGHTLLTRIVPAGIAGAGVVSLVVWRRVARVALAVAGLAAAGAMWADSASSHAGGESPAAFNLAMQWVHAVAVGVWIGGLVALLSNVRGLVGPARGVAARRFSTAAAVALVIVAASGIARTVVEVQSWSNLATTAFGKLVLLKIGLIVVLAILGAVNRFRNVPAAARALRGLRRVGSAEVVVAAAALLVAAALVNVAPPVSAAPPAVQPPLVVSGSDDATTLRVRLEVSPGTPGFNRFVARVTDYDSGTPVAAQSVQLFFRLTARTDLGASRLALTRSTDGSYAGRGANLSLDGTWEVIVLVERGAQSTEVTLRLATRSLPEKIDVSRIPGEPTLYTIHLRQGGTVQVYIDPNKPGNVEFHSTFFDAAGNELPVVSATIAMTPPGGTAQALPARELEPGHYVADATMGAGAYGFDISGTTAGGQRISTHIDITAGT